MMEDDYYDPYQQKSGPSPARWLLFVLFLILGPIGTIGITLLAPADMIPIYMIFYMSALDNASAHISQWSSLDSTQAIGGPRVEKLLLQIFQRTTEYSPQ